MVRLTIILIPLIFFGCQQHKEGIEICLTRIDVQNPLRQKFDDNPSIILSFRITNQSKEKLILSRNSLRSKSSMDNFILYSDNSIVKHHNLKLWNISQANTIQKSQITPLDDIIAFDSRERYSLSYSFDPNFNLRISSDTIAQSNYKQTYYRRINDIFSSETFLNLYINEKSYPLKQIVDNKIIHYE